MKRVPAVPLPCFLLTIILSAASVVAAANFLATYRALGEWVDDDV